MSHLRVELYIESFIYVYYVSLTTTRLKFTCSDRVSAHESNESAEMQCDICSSLFVERLGQGVESFLHSSSTNPIELDHEAVDPNADISVSNNVDSVAHGRYASPQVGRISSGGIIPEASVASSGGVAVATDMFSTSDSALSGELFSGIIQRILGATLPQLAQDPTLMSAGRPVGVVMRTNFVPGGGGVGLGGYSAVGGGGVSVGDQALENLLHHILMNESSYRTRGVDPDEIKKLRRLSVDESTDIQELGPCGISMDDFEPGDVAVVLPCNHAYKENLILHWFETHQTCPSCRKELPQSP